LTNRVWRESRLWRRTTSSRSPATAGSRGQPAHRPTDVMFSRNSASDGSDRRPAGLWARLAGCLEHRAHSDRQHFGECLSSTLLVATSPAPGANLQRRRNSLNRKLLQPSHLPSVPRSRSFSTARTRSTSLTLRGYDPAVPMERDALHDNPGPERQLRCLRHPPDYAQTANQGKIEHEK
jgi:hypothetical protein